MPKNIIKTETVAEFIARGGQIKKVIAKPYKKLTLKQLGYQKEIEVVEEIDMTSLPMALKIKYGVRD